MLRYSPRVINDGFIQPMMQKNWKRRIFILPMVYGVFAVMMSLSAAAQALSLKIPQSVTQGQMVTGFVTPPTAKVTLGETPLYVGRDGRIVFGVARDQKAPLALKAMADNQTVTQTLNVTPRTWSIQKIPGLPKKFVTPNPEQEARIKADQAQIKTTRTAPITRDFLGIEGFKRPAEGPISGIFGSQRILNGIPKAPHYGLDIAGPVGTPIIAPAPGVVALVNPDMFLTGKTVMLDHGAGVYSVFIHMNDIDVKPGQEVTSGTRLGTIGKTGRVSGPHLHWGITVAGVPVDPAGVLEGE
jgi:murein DD-endopeptidase MepM/ murein hydrolase activator NlpD